MINRVVELRAHGNPILVETTCAKLIFKGVNPEAFNDQSCDAPRWEKISRMRRGPCGAFCATDVPTSRSSGRRQHHGGRRKHARHISGLIDFHCILRTLDLRRQRRCDEYGAIFSAIPTIGFSTYGEEYLGHMNQTSTMLLFR